MKIFLLFLFLVVFQIFAKEDKTFYLKQILNLSLENNPNLQKLKHDLSIADVDYLKSQSKYETNFKIASDFKKSNIKKADNNSSLVDKETQDTASTGLEKTYKTGTTLGVSATTDRTDSNKDENVNYKDVNASPPVFTGDLKLELKQDLLQNAFGFQDINNDFISENKTKIKKLQIRQDIAEILSQTLISYWDYLLKDANVQTYEELYKNVDEVKQLVIRKNKIGLSQKYEINQWNALLLQASNRIEEAKIEKQRLRRDLARQLNIDEKELSINIESYSKRIKMPSFEDDLKIAYQNRRDYQSLKVKQKNTLALIENSKRKLFPTLNANLSVGSKYQNYNSHSTNFSSSNIGSLKI